MIVEAVKGGGVQFANSKHKYWTERQSGRLSQS